MYKSHITRLFLPILILWLAVAPAAAATRYVVQRGDTLYAIARRFNTSVSALAGANNIVNPNLIFVGQVLQIPDAAGSGPGATPLPPSPSAGSTTYTVQRGDTMTRIALRFGTSVQAIAQANDIANPSLIFVGQTLVIPGAGSPPAATPPASRPPVATPPAPTPTPSPQPTLPPATVPPAPPAGVNLLPNASFEEGWYNQNGAPELQVPNHWRLEWDEGPTGFGDEAWDVYVRPETRVLPSRFLPADEHPLYIWDGDHTVKIFKGNGAISVRLLTDVTLQPGTYTFELNVFPDLVVGYNGGRKIWAPDPLSGDVRIMVGNGGTDWLLPTFGRRNTLRHTFTVAQPQTLTVGVALRGRFAIQNNGWFVDDWSLQRVD